MTVRRTVSLMASIVLATAAFSAASPEPSTASVVFHSSCPLRETFERAKLAGVIASVHIEAELSDPGRGGKEAIAIDINGDSVPEYFVPYDCSPTGNCLWAVAGGAPKRILAEVNAKVIAVDRVQRGWATIYGYGHMSAGSGVITVYRWNGRKYSAGPTSDELEGEAVRVFQSCEDNPNCCPSTGNLTTR